MDQLSNFVALDCEMVGSGRTSLLARVSIVNHRGACIYDEYVKPTAIVTDYRTCISGIRPHHLVNCKHFRTVQAEVDDMIRGKVVVGYDLQKDFDVLRLPRRRVKDLSTMFADHNGQKISLKRLVRYHLNERIQEGEHSSVEDAMAAMRLYRHTIRNSFRSSNFYN